MAGVAEHPSREVYLRVARQIQLDGGRINTYAHAGQPVEYPESVSDGLRKQAERAATTCGCGDTRMVTLAYEVEQELSNGDTFRQQKRYVACVNCDAVHLQPRYLEATRGE